MTKQNMTDFSFPDVGDSGSLGLSGLKFHVLGKSPRKYPFSGWRFCCLKGREAIRRGHTFSWKRIKRQKCCHVAVAVLIYSSTFISSFQWQVICASPTVKMNSVLFLFICLFYLNGPKREPDESIPSASPKMHARSTNAF